MTRELTDFERLVDDLEEELITTGLLALHAISAYAGAQERLRAGESPAAIETDVRRAYDFLNDAYALHLEWFDWPPRGGRPAAAEVELDFEIREWDDTPRAFLALVADDLDVTADVIQKKWAALAAEVRGGGDERAPEDPA